MKTMELESIENRRPLFMPSRLVPPARGLALALAALTVAYALAIMFLKARMPSQVDVWEGKVLSEAARWAATGRFYEDPAVRGAASIYTPLYQIVLGMGMRLLPPSFGLGRVLSILATLASACLILGFCRLWRRPAAALLTLAAFLASSWQSEWFGALVKSDALCHLLWLAGLFLATSPHKKSHLAASALLTALAFYAKQTALFAVPGILLFLLIENRRAALVWLAIYLAAMAAGWWLFKAAAGEWMAFYVFGRTAVQTRRNLFSAKLWRMLLLPRELPALLAATLLGLALFPRLKTDRRYRAALCLLPFLAAGSVWTASTPGGGLNSMMPLWFAMTVIGGCALAYVASIRSAIDWRAWVAAGLLLALQLDSMAPYRVSKSLGRFDRDFVAVLEYLRERPGAVYAPTHNVFSVLLGRPVYDDLVLAREIGWHWRERDVAENRIRERVNNGDYEWLIMDKPHADADLFDARGGGIYERAADTETWTVYRRISAP